MPIKKANKEKYGKFARVGLSRDASTVCHCGLNPQSPVNGSIVETRHALSLLIIRGITGQVSNVG